MKKQQVCYHEVSIQLFSFCERLGFCNRYRQILTHPLTTNVPHHIETSQLICSANQLTDFYMMGNTGR